MKPTIVTLCGSTRFNDAFAEAQLNETLAGKIVLTVGCFTHADSEIFISLSDGQFAETKRQLDALHMRKIEISDEILVLNVDNYVGESTSREIAYAYQLGKKIRWLVARLDDSGWMYYLEWAGLPDYIALTKPDRPRTCPHLGCDDPYNKKPPCALCYE